MRNGDSKTTSSTTCVESPGSSLSPLNDSSFHKLALISLQQPTSLCEKQGLDLQCWLARILFTKLCSPPWRTTSWWVKPGRLESLHSRRRTTLLRTTNHLDISSWERLKNICTSVITWGNLENVWKHMKTFESVYRTSENIWEPLH